MTIDWWTLGIQTINVVILVWLLKRFFWAPVSKMIDHRRAEVQKAAAEGERKRNEADAALVEIEKTRAGFAAERQAILAAAHDSAEKEAATLISTAKKEIATLEAAAKLAAAKDEALVSKTWTVRSSQLAVEIAKRLADRLSGPAVDAAFLDWLLDGIKKLPEATRQTVAEKGIMLEATSAKHLVPADEDRYRKCISEAFGTLPQIAFKVDPDLIVGFELQGPHLVVSNSWRADLNQILADLTHDK